MLFYTGVWLFHIIGRVLYANRDAIGLDAERAPERDQEKADAEQMQAQNVLLAQIFPVSRAGKYSNAMQAIDTYLERNDSPDDEQRLFDALMTWEDPYLGLKLGQRRLDRFVDGKNMVSALRLCGRCVAADDRFRPKGADTTIRIAQAALADGRSPARSHSIGRTRRFRPPTIRGTSKYSSKSIHDDRGHVPRDPRSGRQL